MHSQMHQRGRDQPLSPARGSGSAGLGAPGPPGMRQGARKKVVAASAGLSLSSPDQAMLPLSSAQWRRGPEKRRSGLAGAKATRLVGCAAGDPGHSSRQLVAPGLPKRTSAARLLHSLMRISSFCSSRLCCSTCGSGPPAVCNWKS